MAALALTRNSSHLPRSLIFRIVIRLAIGDLLRHLTKIAAFRIFLLGDALVKVRVNPPLGDRVRQAFQKLAQRKTWVPRVSQRAALKQKAKPL